MDKYLKRQIMLFLLIPGLAVLMGCGFKEKDTTPPVWEGTNLTNVALNSRISTSFSESVSIDKDLSTVTSNNGVVRRGTFSDGGTVSFTPDRPFNFGTTYTVTLRNVHDSAGNRGNDVSFTFTTVSNAPSTYHATPAATADDEGRSNSIVLSPDGTTFISYYKITATEKSLYIISTTDAVSFQGPYKIAGPFPLGTDSVEVYSSLMIDNSGTLHVAYYHEGVGLQYSKSSDIAGPWVQQTVDNGGGLADVGKYTSMDLGSNNSVHISYYDETNHALKYATNANAGGIWANSTIDSGGKGENRGLYSSIRVDANDIVHISYYDDVLKDLRYVNSTNWIPTALDTTNQAGKFSTLQLDSSGNVYIFYNYIDWGGTWWIRCMTNASGVWKHHDIAAIDKNDTANPAVIDDLGVWHLSYFSHGILYYRSGVLYDVASNEWEWSPAISVDDEGLGNGFYSSIAVNSNFRARISYYDAQSKDLKLAF